MTAQRFTQQNFQPEELIGQQDGHRVQAQILPRLGANLISLKVDDQDLIYFDKQRLINENVFTGCFMMFPTPCRLTDAEYTFGGKHVKQTKNGQVVAIHGLIRDENFAISRTENTLRCSIDIDQQHPVYQGYPFCCRFALEFSLLRRGLQIAFEFTNTGPVEAPFGYGLHPFWRIPGHRKDVFIQVPCEQSLEMANLIPTGNTLPVAGTPLDLRSFRPLTELNIDNVFCQRIPNGQQAIQYRDLGKQLTLHSSDVCGHMIAYAPSGQPFVCMENLTCCPDAPNLYARGKQRVSGLRCVAPGTTLAGSVKYIITDLEPPLEPGKTLQPQMTN